MYIRTCIYTQCNTNLIYNTTKFLNQIPYNTCSSGHNSDPFFLTLGRPTGLGGAAGQGSGGVADLELVDRGVDRSDL